MTDDNEDEIHVTFTWAELRALLQLLNTQPTHPRLIALETAWAKLADAHQANDPPERAYR